MHAISNNRLNPFRKSFSPVRTVLAAMIFLVCVAPAAWAKTLTVALYPFVPRLPQFASVISKAWAQQHPNVPLKIIADKNLWDGGYGNDPKPEYDVYVFDAMFFEQFRASNLLAPMTPNEIKDAADFLPYAREAVTVNGKYYAIPQLGCANILFYNAKDTAIANATTLSQLKSALNQCTFTSKIPPDRRGLMMDLAGKTTNATFYLDIAHSVNGTYPLPQPTHPEASYIADQKTMLNISSYLNVTEINENDYIRGVWYSDGYGRAIVGFTETMSNMSPAALSTIRFKVMPMSNTTGHRPLFFVDAVGVNTSTIKNGTRDLAVQLANLIASTNVEVASFKGEQKENPQYLMAVRNSVFQALGQKYPIYQRMYKLAKSSNPIAFKLDKNARNWAETMGATIRTEVRANYACGCDQQSNVPINSNAQAQSVCPSVCGGHGGWNGQWTNQPPAQGSVCGCKVCPIR